MVEEEDEFGDGDVPLFLVVLQIVVSVIIISENITLIYLIYKNEVLHTTSYFFITSLGVTDLVVGVLSVVGASYYLVNFYPRAGVKSMATSIYICLAIGMSMLSCIHMAVISVERYVYIAYPFHHQKYMTFRFIAKLITAVWIMGAIYITCICFAQFTTCRIKLLKECHKIAKLGGIVSVYILVTSVTGISYVLILRVVSHKRRSISSSGVQNGSAARWTVTAKSLKFFISVFGIYLVTTFPAMFDMFFHDIEIPAGLRFALLPFLISNSGTNFLVLLVVDRTFRDIVTKNLCGLISNGSCRNKRSISEVPV